MYKVVIFGRVSTFQQSYEEQVAELTRQAIREGYTEEECITIEAKESAIKLDFDERQTLNELWRVLDENPSIEVIICREISRVARRENVAIEVRDRLIERGVNLISTTPYMRLLERDNQGNLVMSYGARLIYSTMSTLAAMEMEQKAERFKEGKTKARKEGRFCGGKVVYGYQTDKQHRFEIVPEEADIIKQIFHLYTTTDMSTAQVADDLLSRGVLWHTSRSSAITFVSVVLRNHAYCGESTLLNYTKCAEGKVKYGYDSYPPLVTQEVYHKAEAKRKAANTRGQSKCSKHIYYGIGIVKYQGHRMSRANGRGGYMYRDPETNKSCTVNTNFVDTLLWYHCCKIVAQVAKQDNEAYKDELHAKQKVLFDKMLHVESEKERISKAYDTLQERIIMGKVSSDLADSIEAKLEREKANNDLEWGRLNKLLLDMDTRILEAHSDTPTDCNLITDHTERINLIHKYIERCDIECMEDSPTHYKISIEGYDYEVDTHQKRRWIIKDGQKMTLEIIQK